MKSHPAQTNNLPDLEMRHLLERSAIAVSIAVNTMAGDHGKPRRAAKDQIRRDLAGVIADLETIRLGLS